MLAILVLQSLYFIILNYVRLNFLQILPIIFAIINPEDFFFENLDPDLNYYNALSPSGRQSQYFSVSQFNALISDSLNSITMINFNIRSFYANSDDFFCLFDDGNMPQIYILTETWFSNENAWNLEGYNMHLIILFGIIEDQGGFQFT